MVSGIEAGQSIGVTKKKMKILRDFYNAISQLLEDAYNESPYHKKRGEMS